mmetsp:Transcript_23771/g.71499  ORF Transcript_23771/g.71499 Transcript_23771/m.71499 type:complete len:188 (+) Transcript_23771:1340-1903(+)
MLIMLQDKAETSSVATISGQTANLVKSNDELSNRVSALLVKQTEDLANLTSASECGDSVLHSRLNDLEASLLSIRGSAKALPKSQTIKLPAAQTQSSGLSNMASPSALATHDQSDTVRINELHTQEAESNPKAVDQKSDETRIEFQAPQARSTAPVPHEPKKKKGSPPVSRVSLVSYLQPEPLGRVQ